MTTTVRVTAESFGADIPENWEVIAEAINARYEAAGLLDRPLDELTADEKETYHQIWEDYFG